MGKPSVKVSPLKKLRSEFVSEPTAPPIVKAKDNYPRSIPITEYADQNAVRKFPLPSVNYDTSKGLNTEELNFWALFCKSFFSSWEYLYETSPMVFPTTTSKDWKDLCHIPNPIRVQSMRELQPKSTCKYFGNSIQRISSSIK